MSPCLPFTLRGRAFLCPAGPGHRRHHGVPRYQVKERRSDRPPGSSAQDPGLTALSATPRSAPPEALYKEWPAVPQEPPADFSSTQGATEPPVKVRAVWVWAAQRPTGRNDRKMEKDLPSRGELTVTWLGTAVTGTEGRSDTGRQQMTPSCLSTATGWWRRVLTQDTKDRLRGGVGAGRAPRSHTTADHRSSLPPFSTHPASLPLSLCYGFTLFLSLFLSPRTTSGNVW